jgi:hypothetical protein
MKLTPTKSEDYAFSEAGDFRMKDCIKILVIENGHAFNVDLKHFRRLLFLARYKMGLEHGTWE